jgi:hypothetical protein
MFHIILAQAEGNHAVSFSGGSKDVNFLFDLGLSILSKYDLLHLGIICLQK